MASSVMSLNTSALLSTLIKSSADKVIPGSVLVANAWSGALSINLINNVSELSFMVVGLEIVDCYSLKTSTL